MIGRAHAPKRTQIPLRILGALLDFPALLDDPDVEAALSALDGDAALAIAALRQNLDRAPTQRATRSVDRENRKKKAPNLAARAAP